MDNEFQTNNSILGYIMIISNMILFSILLFFIALDYGSETMKIEFNPETLEIILQDRTGFVVALLIWFVFFYSLNALLIILFNTKRIKEA